jgi:hypothetical protein
MSKLDTFDFPATLHLNEHQLLVVMTCLESTFELIRQMRSVGVRIPNIPVAALGPTNKILFKQFWQILISNMIDLAPSPSEVGIYKGRAEQLRGMLEQVIADLKPPHTDYLRHAFLLALGQELNLVAGQAGTRLVDLRRINHANWG